MEMCGAAAEQVTPLVNQDLGVSPIEVYKLASSWPRWERQ